MPATAEIFCIGFHKTGTSRLAVALERLGYRVTGPNGGHDPAIAVNVLPMARRLDTRISISAATSRTATRCAATLPVARTTCWPWNWHAAVSGASRAPFSASPCPWGRFRMPTRRDGGSMR